MASRAVWHGPRGQPDNRHQYGTALKKRGTHRRARRVSRDFMTFYRVFCIFSIKWGNHLDSVRSRRFSAVKTH